MPKSGVICQEFGCNEPAEVRCEGCGRLFCWRCVGRHELEDGRWMTLCRDCSVKLFSGRFK
jgi:hypothetical protein